MDPSIALLGLGVGFLVGVSGMGSGSLMTPLLIILLGVRPIVAVGSDLAYAAITKIVGAAQHLRQNTVDPRTVVFLAMGSVPGGIAGVLLITWYKGVAGANVDILVQRALGGSLALAGLVMLLTPLLYQRFAPVGTESPLARKNGRLITMVIGVLVGTLVGLTSVGSGSLLVPFLFFYYRFPASKIVGTDVFHGALLISAAGLAHWNAGNVDLGLVANLLIGSIPGVLIGSRLTLKVPETVLRAFVASLLLLVGVRLI